MCSIGSMSSLGATQPFNQFCFPSGNGQVFLAPGSMNLILKPAAIVIAGAVFAFTIGLWLE